MTRPRTIACGQGETAARVEYVKSRGVLRLTTGARAGSRELTMGAFCHELGIQPEVLNRPTYLLFAGTDRLPAGGCRDLVATYDCPDEARREFTARRRDSGCLWAELVSLVGGRVAAVCWFGVDRVDRALPARPPVKPPRRRPTWLRGRRPQASSKA